MIEKFEKIKDMASMAATVAVGVGLVASGVGAGILIGGVAAGPVAVGLIAGIAVSGVATEFVPKIVENAMDKYAGPTKAPAQQTATSAPAKPAQKQSAQMDQSMTSSFKAAQANTNNVSTTPKVAKPAPQAQKIKM